MVEFTAWLACAVLLAPTAPDPGAGARTQEPNGAQAAGSAMELWNEWALAFARDGGDRYSPTVAADGRVLLWSSKGSRSSKLKRSVKKTVSAFDALFPPDGRAADAGPVRTAVLLELADAQALASVTTFLGGRFAPLAGWAPAAAKGVGFALEEPLAAAWLVDVPENEVWSPENELVNRLARLLTLERFGRLPHWLETGLAWQLELDVCKDVFSFPYRAGFVSKKEHKRWDTRLAAAVKARGERAPTVAELAGWRRGTWDETVAPIAWGAAALLARHYDAELPTLFAAYTAERRARGRTVHADGRWESIADYEVPAARERELLDEALGVDFEAELARFARAPRSYRRPR